MAAVYEEMARPRVLATVEDLVAREESGVIEVAGSPSGAIYLDGGDIAFAWASWVPGLAPRLRASCPALPALAELPPGQDADDIAIAGLAIRRGYLTAAGLEEILRSIVVDSFLVLTIPLAADSPVTGIRFTSTRTYWTDMLPRLGLDFVRAEALRRAKRIAGYGLSPATAVALRDLAAPVTVLTREQWSVACQIGQQTSARELAMRRGGALSDTMECLGILIRAGVCTPVGEPPSQPPPAERLPVRHPVQDLAARVGRAGQSPTADILHQVLSGLRKLS